MKPPLLRREAAAGIAVVEDVGYVVAVDAVDAVAVVAVQGGQMSTTTKFDPLLSLDFKENNFVA